MYSKCTDCRINTFILVDMCGSAISNHGPVSYCIDDTKPDGSHPAIMGFILANQARNLMHLSEKERFNTIININIYSSHYKVATAWVV